MNTLLYFSEILICMCIFDKLCTNIYIYYVVGSLSFGPDTNGDILVNLTGHFADAFKLLFVIHLLL